MIFVYIYINNIYFHALFSLQPNTYRYIPVCRNWFTYFVFVANFMCPMEIDSLCRFFCPNNECGRSYKRKSGLTQHLNYECGVEKKFQCMMCGQKYAQKSTMKSHMKKIHKIYGSNVSRDGDFLITTWINSKTGETLLNHKPDEHVLHTFNESFSPPPCVLYLYLNW